MKLKAYWVGGNIVAAPDPENALLVIARHETGIARRLEDVRELSDEDMAKPVDPTRDTTVMQVLKTLMDLPLSPTLPPETHGIGALLYWEYHSL